MKCKISINIGLGEVVKVIETARGYSKRDTKPSVSKCNNNNNNSLGLPFLAELNSASLITIRPVSSEQVQQGKLFPVLDILSLSLRLVRKVA